jgi:arabinan endo-1,5-alpha-L-arabinosidase
VHLTATGLAAALLSAGLPAAPTSAQAPVPVTRTYTNPLKPTLSDGGTVQNCPDPSVLPGKGANAGTWYMYCTSDPLNDAATSGAGAPRFTRLPTFRSRDLVHWAFVDSALPGKPAWAGAHAKLWAPDVVWSSTYHRYYMTFAVTDVQTSISHQSGCDTDNAIGVAVSSSPTGPWRISSQPLVPPRRVSSGCHFENVIDPDVLGDSIGTTGVLYFGSFVGGLRAVPVRVSSTGMARTASSRAVAQDRRFEGANVVDHGGWHYLFASTGSCCNGPMSGYAVVVGRSRSAYGPFLDREGVPMLDSRAGGTPVLQMNGTRWLGPGHSSAFPDAGGQWWLVYHAIDRSDPFFATEPGFTRRAPMLDPVDWVDGWPTVRAGRGSSTGAVRAPAGQPGHRSTYVPSPLAPDRLGTQLADYSDEFDGTTPADRWSWVREPDATSYAVQDGQLRLDTTPTQLVNDTNDAPVLTEPAPSGDYVVETQVSLDVPATGTGFDGVQAGLVVYGGDDRYLKLVQVAVGDTRQTAFAQEVPTAPNGGTLRYGGTPAGPPGDTTWLRVTKKSTATHSYLRADTSRDGTHWVRGASYRYDGLGSHERIGLLSMGGAGFSAHFDHVRVWPVS